MTWLRSLAFQGLFYGFTALCCLGLVWTGLLPRRRMMTAVRAYLAGVAWLERAVLGLDYRVLGRERLPPAPFIVAAKHQSTWETLKLHLLFGDPAVVLKQELLRLPVWGWFARRAGMIPVDRKAGSLAIPAMAAEAERRAAEGRPIVIFPQGTRVAPGAASRYRTGVAALYERLALPVVPVALNSGMFWRPRGLGKRPGVITVEILPPIAPGLGRDEFMARLADQLERATDRLVVSVGGPAVLPAGPPPTRPRTRERADARA